MLGKQILDKLAAAGPVRALDEDLARWVGRQMLGPEAGRAELGPRVIPPILARWRCLLDAEDASAAYRDKMWVALATLLHRYGLQDDTVTDRAVTAVDDLDRDVVLADTFARQAPAIKAFLRSPPTPLTRRPRQPRATTLFRAGDVLSVQHDGRFHAAFVREVHGTGRYPVIELYAGVFGSPPTLAQLSGRAAARERGRARYGVVGLTYLPDPAGQVVAIAAARTEGPQGGDPGPADGLYTLTDLIELPRYFP
ncbi:hypothetical protein ACWKSP_15055 [Micromonosporaceae bacterium Da 78-11]